MRTISFGDNSVTSFSNINISGLVFTFSKVVGNWLITSLPDIEVHLVRGGVKTLIVEGNLGLLFRGTSKSLIEGNMTWFDMNNNYPPSIKGSLGVNFWNCYHLNGSDKINVKLSFKGFIDSNVSIVIKEVGSLLAEGSIKHISAIYTKALVVEDIFSSKKKVLSFRVGGGSDIGVTGIPHEISHNLLTGGFKSVELKTGRLSFLFDLQLAYLKAFELSGSLFRGFNLIEAPVFGCNVIFKFDGINNIADYFSFVVIEEL